MTADDSGEEMLILGGASLIGRFLLPMLAGRGLAGAALSRRPPPLAIPGVRWIRGDIEDPATAALLPRARTVLSLAPIWVLAPALPALLESGARRIVAFSSTSRFTKADSAVPEERAVAARLAAGEAALQAACTAGGAHWTILRPTLIYAEGRDGNVTRLARMIDRLGFLPLAGSGEGLRQPVHAEDLAVGALDAAAAPAACDRAYDVPGGETLSYADMAGRVFESLGRRPRLLHVPPGLWKLGLALASPVLPGATAGMGARMSVDLTFDAAPARRDFGWSPRPFRPDFSGVRLN